MRISVTSSFCVFLAIVALLPPAFADQSDKTDLGCIWLDTSASELNLGPADQRQRWCDLTPDQPSIACFDFSVDGKWVQTASFPAEFVLGRQSAGVGLCPSITDRVSSTVRD